jgi:hypothetical protein
MPAGIFQLEKTTADVRAFGHSISAGGVGTLVRDEGERDFGDRRIRLRGQVSYQWSS